jgi:hypothetical protein
MKKFDESVTAFERSIQAWQAHPKDDRQMKAAYAADRKRLRAVLSSYRRKLFGEAYATARLLDTILRDLIPDLAWETMKKHHSEKLS